MRDEPRRPRAPPLDGSDELASELSRLLSSSRVAASLAANGALLAVLAHEQEVRQVLRRQS